MKEQFIVVLLAGDKGCGKDSVAFRLEDEHKFAHTAYADFLKEMCVTLLHKMDCEVTFDHFHKQELKNEFIYDIDGKKFLFKTPKRNGVPMTYRQFMQQLGTEAIRNNIHNEAWIIPVKKFIREAYTHPEQIFRGVVVSDARFPNEIEEIKNYCKMFGGMVEIIDVEIIRPELDNKDKHASETSLKNHKFTIGLLNDGTLADLFMKVDRLATGGWRLDKINTEIKMRYDKHWMREYDER